MSSKNSVSKQNHKSHGLCLYALDRAGHSTHAKYAIPKESFTCLGCGARVYRTHRNDKYYFACCPGEVHTSPNCHTDGTLYDITLTAPSEFFSILFGKQSPHGPAKGFGPARGPRESVSRCTTLKQIYDSGIIFHPPENDCFGDYHIGQLILTKRMLADPNTMKQSLSNRIIYALPEYADYVHRTLRFVVLHNTIKDGTRITGGFRFLLEFKDHPQDFRIYRSKLFSVDGKPIRQPVLVAATWRLIPKTKCAPHCGKTQCHSAQQQCTGFQIGKYHCHKQIYIPKPNKQSKRGSLRQAK